MALDNDRSRIAHLLRRAGFGFTEAELNDYTALGFGGTVHHLLNPEGAPDTLADQKLAAFQLDPKNLESAKNFWVTRMLYTRKPLQEKLTLFWHDHFATANSKVNDPQLMLNQLDLFRNEGFGNFETLLQRVTRDPAMLIYLDNRQNRRNANNENYAREVMELFTVGIGNYTEDDIKAAAKAFTGYGINGQKQFVFTRNNHDVTNKTFMGETKNWDADDILARLVRHPATARLLTTKLFSWFAYPNPEPATVDRLAATFTRSNFNIKAVLQDIFTGPEFLSAKAYHGSIKMPVELVLGSLKALDTQSVGPDLTATLRRMGQDLLNPPDVSGWPGGTTWISANSLFERFNFANKLATSRDSTKPYFTDVAGVVKSRGLNTPDAIVDHYARLLVDGDLTAEARASLVAYLKPGANFTFNDRTIDEKVRGVVHLTMSLPSYQLA
jgi:uncharacterized protein (DUF1800 family)